MDSKSWEVVSRQFIPQKIKSGQFSRVLVWHTNRLSRNPMESGIIMQMLSDGTLEEIRTPQSSITPDNANDILLGVEFGANSQFSRELSKNTKRGIREKILRGEWPTYAPPFYINTGNKKGEKNIVPDPETSQYYERFIDKIMSERIPSNSAYKVLNEWGVKSKKGNFMSRNTVIRLMRNPVYYGAIKLTGFDEPKQGNWTPLVTYKKWRELQDYLDNKAKPYQTKQNLPYRKMIKCGKCGYTVVPYCKKNVHTYFACSKRGGQCQNSIVKLDDLENLMIDIVSEIQFSDEVKTQMKSEVFFRIINQRSEEDIKREENRVKLKKIDTDLDDLLDLRIDKEITPEEYQIKKKKLLDQKEEIGEIQDDGNFNAEVLRNQLELLIDECLQLRDLFINGDSQERTAIMNEIMEELILEDKSLRWNFKKPYNKMIGQDFSSKNFDWGK